MKIKKRIDNFYNYLTDNPNEAREATIAVFFASMSFLLLLALLTYILCNIGPGGPLG